jgi:hypothetical protein
LLPLIRCLFFLIRHFLLTALICQVILAYGYCFSVGNRLLFPESEQSPPPGDFITKPPYHKDIFTLPAAPGPELLVIIGAGTTAARAGSAYLLRCILINISPVSVIPPRPSGHFNLLTMLQNHAFSWLAILTPNSLLLGSSPPLIGPFIPSTFTDRPGTASFNPGTFSPICFSIFLTAFSKSRPI